MLHSFSTISHFSQPFRHIRLTGKNRYPLIHEKPEAKKHAPFFFPPFLKLRVSENRPGFPLFPRPFFSVGARFLEIPFSDQNHPISNQPLRAVMEDPKLSNLEELLRFGTSSTLVSDASVLSCGCLVSEAQFRSLLTSNSVDNTAPCPVCKNGDSLLLKSVMPLRALFKLVQQLQQALGTKRRRRSEPTDLLTLFCKFAHDSELSPETLPIDFRKRPQRSASPASRPESRRSSHVGSLSRASFLESLHLPFGGLGESPVETRIQIDPVNTRLLFSHEKEYNFSRCFPLHRKLTTFPTQQAKFPLAPFRKAPRFIGSSIHTHVDETGREVTRFVLISDKRWELYEFYGEDETRPTLIACGKLTGEYGPDPGSLKAPPVENDGERLNSWEHLHCKLSSKWLVIAGTKGVMRVLCASGDVGKPAYTYTTDFPIRCVAVAPDDALVACGVTARERVSNHEQPFIILHRMGRPQEPVEPITITLPHRDPLKLLEFNSSGTHLLCCTAWEARCLLIRLRAANSENYRRPRLIWSDSKLVRGHGDAMDDEGVTDVQFGPPHSDTLMVTQCSLQNRPPVTIKLEEGTRDDSSLWDDGDFAHVIGADIVARVPGVGSQIHRFAASPRGDGIVYLNKTGYLYLVPTTTAPSKAMVVLLGEMANAERLSEAAAVLFSPDGGKVYSVDRRGVFAVFDFTKGVPGVNLDVVKCKIVGA